MLVLERHLLVAAEGRLKRLRKIEQRGPQLPLDFRAAVRVLDVLRGQRSEQLFRMRIHDEQRAESPRRQLRGGRGNAPERRDQFLLSRERVGGYGRSEPALRRSGVRQRILAGSQKPEHRITFLVGPSITQQRDQIPRPLIGRHRA